MKRFLPLLLALGLLALSAGIFYWRSSVVSPSARQSDAETGPADGVPWFEDATDVAGIPFRHFDSATANHYIHETMGSGLGWIDYDNDGWLDLFCVQDGPLEPSPAAKPLPGNKLYRNNGDGTFTDVTDAVGLARSGFGMGCAVGDFDNDGYDDLAVTYLGGIVLYHNQPDGHGGRRFQDVTERAGLRDPHWATSCGWGDVDGDGRLDLYVCNYVEADLADYRHCRSERTGGLYTCPPTVFSSVTHRLYRNNGDGVFTDISESAGIASASPAPGLAVALVDLDGDGRLDIYAANDMKPAYLFHNQGNGRFVEKGVFAGCGLDQYGRFLAGMGIAVGDFNGSGRPSLFVTNYHAEPNILFRNNGGLLFQDWSYPSGLGPATTDRLSFGTTFVDADLDGRLDVAIANGHIDRDSQALFDAPYAQLAQLFVGDGKGGFRDVSAQAGDYFRQARVGRGLAWADYDNDGLPDLAYSHVGGPIALLRNATRTANHWIRLELVGDGHASNRNAIGATVEVESGGRKQKHFVFGGGSYLSACDRRLLIGLGEAERVDRVVVRWPSGQRQEFGDLAARRWWRLHEGREQAEIISPAKPSR
ncbi:MAG TPA: CRTAC1 family protein [Gemmataceae bacterium]